ncbi:MAG TPA: DUF1858 domain-containing protein [Clostridia bacterium]|nr:DUF1858 domain-containing protein [Clostridia bacterium]
MVDKDMKISDILEKDRALAEVFLRHGLFCIGCPAASQETVEEACISHGVDADDLINDINEFIKNKN